MQIEYWAPNSEIEFTTVGGSELLVLSGELTEQNDQLGHLSWLRLPAGYQVKAQTGGSEVKLWHKHGHLKNVKNPIK